ncbi:hypothetical protein MSAN_00188800 [Mycena sanguinolenta]|uniref:Uncharacterized protein n=1 Tax=Mycena sanguinolenta TaxID=230812 RepID=A0A8H6ZHW3_9AGAR|nr:hypothetical protein MSAN_00188800 [Mycena sanguinolenta]
MACTKISPLHLSSSHHIVSVLNMPSLFLVTLLSLFAAPTALAGSSCIAFDTNWDLLAFGYNGKDYNVGTSDQWTSGKPTDITASGRPPFDGTDTKCYLAQFYNAVYVLGADTANPANIYIYDATAKSWTMQTVTAGGFDPTSFEAILDHDTNFFYALSKGDLWSLDMQSLIAAQSSAIAWQDTGAAEIDTTNYDGVMAIAQNHIFFFGVPGVAAGSAPIYVIHFGFWQEGAQSFSSNFPDSHGQATSFFVDSGTNAGVQNEIAFIPDDGSATYVINVDTNTTQTLAGPSTVDANARYFASETALVQIASNGALIWLPYNPTDSGANTAATWSPVTALNSVTNDSPGASAASGGSSSGTSGSSTGKSGASNTAAGGSAATGSKSGSGASPSSTGSSGATRNIVWGSGTVLGLIAAALSLL